MAVGSFQLRTMPGSDSLTNTSLTPFFKGCDVDTELRLNKLLVWFQTQASTDRTVSSGNRSDVVQGDTL